MTKIVERGALALMLNVLLILMLNEFEIGVYAEIAASLVFYGAAATYVLFGVWKEKQND